MIAIMVEREMDGQQIGKGGGTMRGHRLHHGPRYNFLFNENCGSGEEKGSEMLRLLASDIPVRCQAQLHLAWHYTGLC